MAIAEAGMVHIGVAGDDDHIAFVPAQRLHFLPSHGQERGGPSRHARHGLEQAGGDSRGALRTLQDRGKWRYSLTPAGPNAPATGPVDPRGVTR